MNNNNKKGFTLLEIILSVSIISISLMVIIHSFSQAVAAKAAISNYAKAMFLAQEKLFDLSTGLPKEADRQGEFREPFEKFKWYVTTDRAHFSNLAKVDLIIEWKERGRPKNIQVSTIMGQ